MLDKELRSLSCSLLKKISVQLSSEVIVVSHAVVKIIERQSRVPFIQLPPVVASVNLWSSIAGRILTCYNEDTEQFCRHSRPLSSIDTPISLPPLFSPLLQPVFH